MWDSSDDFSDYTSDGTASVCESVSSCDASGEEEIPLNDLQETSIVGCCNGNGKCDAFSLFTLSRTTQILLQNGKFSPIGDITERDEVYSDMGPTTPEFVVRLRDGTFMIQCKDWCILESSVGQVPSKQTAPVHIHRNGAEIVEYCVVRSVNGAMVRIDVFA